MYKHLQQISDNSSSYFRHLVWDGHVAHAASSQTQRCGGRKFETRSCPKFLFIFSVLNGKNEISFDSAMHLETENSVTILAVRNVDNCTYWRIPAKVVINFHPSFSMIAPRSVYCFRGWRTVISNSNGLVCLPLMSVIHSKAAVAGLSFVMSWTSSLLPGHQCMALSISFSYDSQMVANSTLLDVPRARGSTSRVPEASASLW